jgi:NTP pyrophosphatase (non-canonical NTP hydrolase)
MPKGSKVRMEIRKSVLKFAEEMEKKLKENDHKGGWRNCTIDYLMQRLFQEWGELSYVVHQKKPRKEIVSEAADVANFAMMITEVYRKE